MAESFRIGGVGSGYVGPVTGSSEVRPVNIGNPREHTVRGIAEPVIEVSYEPHPEDDPRRRCTDTGRAEESLGWEPLVGAREGLEKTLERFVKRIGALETPLVPKP